MKRFGVMLDMSRNAVMKPSALKNYIKILNDFGYNMIMLYTEDTYEVENEPYFGYLRGRYSVEELKDIVAYCNELNIEIIPCIQTLAHLNNIFKWEEYKSINDVNDILLVDDKRTYELIENMFKTLRPVFTSEYIHVGMDEAHMLGLGKYLEKHGPQNRFEILSKHLKKVIEIAKKYGFKPLMWSDMFFRLANNGEYYLENEAQVTDDIVKSCPDGVDLVYWDYYSNKDEHYRTMMAANKKFKGETWFAGGAWAWKGFIPGNKWSIESMTSAMCICNEVGVENIFMTAWGDNGKECSFYSLLPALYAIRRIYDGVDDIETVKAEFKALTGECFDNMMLLDAPDYVGDRGSSFEYNPTKHMLYSDPFCGYLDVTVQEGEGKEYSAIAEKLHSCEKDSKYAYIYKCIAELCDVMSIKYELGVKTRNAYKKGKSALGEVLSEYRELLKKIDVFYKAFRTLWYNENKPYGFEVQDQRIGGLHRRIMSCADRIEEYLNGNINSIPELEEKLLDYKLYGKPTNRPILNVWNLNVTVNNI